MYLTKDQIDEFNSVISLSIFEDDYGEIVKKRIKKYRKKTFLPGFRKGRVPQEYIRSIYEEKLTNYEVKKILKKVIQATISRENILGKAITLGANRKSKDFFFKFYITFPPKFKIDFKKINTTTDYKILLEEKEVYKKIKSIQRKFGIYENKRKVGMKDQMELKKIGWSKYRTFSPKIQSKFLNAQISMAEFLEELKKWNKIKEIPFPVHFVLKKIFEVKPAFLDQKLFDQFLGIKSHDEFHSEISEILLSSYDSKVDDYLYNDIILEKLVEKSLFKFPKDFIHRYMNSYYPEYMDNKDKYLNKKKEIEHFFRFKLIENKLVNYLKKLSRFQLKIIRKKFLKFFRKKLLKKKKFLRLDEFHSLLD